MIAGAALGFAGIGLPAAEAALAASVVVLGVLIAVDVKVPSWAAAALVAAFALFHGHAHGAEMAPGTSALGYGAGFVAATALLHAAGIVLGRSISGRAARLGGAIIAALGVVLVGA
jgi:urease accessory protein